jgi:hypothetical protein
LEQRWIRLATMDPDSGVVRVYRGDDVFEGIDGTEEALEEVATSRDWYEGRRDHLPLARIQAASTSACRCQAHSGTGRVA